MIFRFVGTESFFEKICGKMGTCQTPADVSAADVHADVHAERAVRKKNTEFTHARNNFLMKEPILAE